MLEKNMLSFENSNRNYVTKSQMVDDDSLINFITQFYNFYNFIIVVFLQSRSTVLQYSDSEELFEVLYILSDP